MITKISNDSKRLGILFLLGFILVFSYAVARPAIDSLYLKDFSSQTLPYAWIATALASIPVIAIYNHFNQKFSILDLYKITSAICFLFLAITMFLYKNGFQFTIAIMYVWKEIYMVVLMEIFWTFADLVFSTNKAKHTYGVTMAVCSVGGILGNILVGPLAKLFGTYNTLYIVLFLLFAGAIIPQLAKALSDEKPTNKKTKAKLNVGLQVLWKSKYLVPLALLVLIAQLVISLIDYSFNDIMQQNYLNTDIRTEVFGYVLAAINIGAIALQVLTGPFLKFVGIAQTFGFIPISLAIFLAAFLFSPQFLILLCVKVFSKVLDYSLLRGVKEMLYIPLTREEKTQGKGLIDIFLYRQAKGLSSLILIPIIAFGLKDFLPHINIFMLIFWCILAIIIAKRYEEVVQNSENKE